jgi:predicted MPP superfamily phosphohydrolase
MNIIRMLIILLIFIAVNVYIFVRGAQALPDKATIKAIYTVLYIFVSSSVFIAIFLGSKLPLWLSHALEIVGGYWIILFVFILIAVLLGDIVRIINHFHPIYPSWVVANYAKAKLFYFYGLFLVLAFIALVGYYRFANPQVKELPIRVNHEVRSKDELNIVVASDIHLGNLIRKARFERWVDLINKQNPDIILLAGDIFDHNIHAVEVQHMDVVLRRLKARYGVYAIPGNHDYYAGIDKAISYMKKSGIMVLRDEAITIDGRMVLIGRDDFTNKERKPLKSLVVGLNSRLPRIVLDHQPLRFEESKENNIDLHISGHTHNGQIWPFNLIVSKIYELGYGYKKIGNTHYYVSSGIGLWGAPIRFGTRSEIVKVQLKVE